MTTPSDKPPRNTLAPDEESLFDSLFDQLTDGASGDVTSSDVATAAETSRPITPVPPPRPSLAPASLTPASMIAGVLASSGSTPPPGDDGAQAARRTVRKRAGRRGQLAYVGRTAEATQARAALLEHLAQRGTSVSQRSRAWTSASELHGLLGDTEAATTTLAHAVQTETCDVVALRRAQQGAASRRDWDHWIELMQREASQGLPPSEQALVLTRAAQCAWLQRGDADRAAQLSERALEADTHALGAALVGVAATMHARDDGRLGAAWTRVAKAWNDATGRADALALAGDAFERASDAGAALDCFEAALQQAPDHTHAALGVMRTARAAGRPEAAAAAAQTAMRSAGDPELKALWTRMAARYALSAGAERSTVLSLLADDNGRLSLRLSAQLSAADGDPATHRVALQRWAQAAAGSERAVALVELARHAIDHDDLAAAEQALVDAAVADGNLGTIRVVRQMLARKRGDGVETATTTATTTESDDDALTSAAKLAHDTAHALAERELLRRACRQGDDALTGEVIALDAAAAAGDREAVFEAVMRQAARARPEDRVGPLTALLDYLPSDSWVNHHAEVDRELQASAPRSPVALRRRGLRVSTNEERAALWLDEAASSEHEHAAFCATLAGDLLQSAGQLEAIAAYRRALTATATYEPAAWALERMARASDDTGTLRDIQERLATQSRLPLERAARLLRAGLLHSTTDTDAAIEHMQQALAEHPGDVIITDLLLRLREAAVTPQLAEQLVVSAQPIGGEVLAAAQMRAATWFEHHRRYGDAARLYRTVFTEPTTSEPFAALSCDRAEVLAGEHARVAQRRIDAVRDAQDSTSRVVALAQLAEFERDRGDMQSAVLALQSLREESPHDVLTLRTLERYYMVHSRTDELQENTEVMIEALAEPTDAASYLRLRLALGAETADSQETIDALLATHAPQTAGDGWVMRREQLAAQRADDADRQQRALLEQATHNNDSFERASLCLRAIDVQPADATHHVLPLLSAVVAAAPHHPIASEELGRLHELNGDHAAAATAFQIAAQAALTTDRKVWLWYRAGVLLQDQAGDTQGALHALREVAALQLLHRDTFTRLHTLLSDAGDSDALVELITQRIALGGDASLLATLHADLSKLRGGLQDRAGAKQGLRDALALDPAHLPSLRALAEMLLTDQEWTEAADVLIQLARLSQDTTELHWAFMALGDIYAHQLPDLKRAEISFSRAVKLMPDDTAAIERLSAVFRSQGQFDLAERGLRRLCELRVNDKEAWLQTQIQIARVVEESGAARRAEDILEEARRAQPQHIAIHRAIADHHARQGDSSARMMQLARAVNEYRNAIEANYSDSNAWLGMVEMLERRDKHDAANLVAQVAYLLDVEAPELRARKRPAAAPTRVLSSALDELAAPSELTEAVREVLKQLGPGLEKLVHGDTRGPIGDKLKTRSEALQQAVQHAGAWLGLQRVEIVTQRTDGCHVRELQPWTLSVGPKVLNDLTDAEKLFVVTRALKLGHSHMTVALNAEPQTLRAAMNGLARWANSMHEPMGSPPGVVDEWARRVGKTFSRKQQEELSPQIGEMIGHMGSDLSNISQVCSRFGARIALVATGDVVAAIRAVLGEANITLPAGDPRGAQKVVARHAVAADLIHFALSDACSTARELVLGVSTMAASATVTPPKPEGR